MADRHKLKDVRSDLLHKFHTAIEENLQDIEGAVKKGRLSTVAWLARNLLELTTWTMYCAQSENKSKEFVLDGARDANDVMNVPDGMLSESFSFQRQRSKNIKKAKDDGFETFEERYMNVEDAAKDLGLGNKFKHYNKLLSKFAHPTAFAILHGDPEAAAKLKQKFYVMGSGWAKDSLALIEARLK